MPEIAVNAPFDSNEIKDILVAEFKQRLNGLVPLQGAKEYASFSADFQVKIHVKRLGEQGAGKETLAWGSVKQGDPSAADLDLVSEEAEIANSTLTSKDPNEERMARDMPLTVETTDGRGGKIRKKARVKAV